MAIRVDALSNNKISYSVKKLDGTNVNALNWKFRWFIVGQSSNEEYGTLFPPINKEYVYATWKPVLPGTENVDRELCCQITVLNAGGEEICNQIVRILVHVVDSANDLTIDFDGVMGSTTSYTGFTASGNTAVKGPLKLTNQCHILGNVMEFGASGSTGVTNFWWQVQPPLGQNSNPANGGGYFVGASGANLGSWIKAPADVNHASTAQVKWTDSPPVPPGDGSYYLKLEGADDYTHLTRPQYLKLKLCTTNPNIVSNSWPTSINVGYPPIYFSWTLKDINSYPEWFQFRAMLEIGEINCQPTFQFFTGPTGPTGWQLVNSPCYGLTDSNYTGPNWLSGSMIQIADSSITDIKTNLTGNLTDYTFGYTIPLPGWFNPAWEIGDPDKFRLKLHTYFWDPELNPSMTGPCIVTKVQDVQDVSLKYCPQPPPQSYIYFKGPTCPTGIPFNPIVWTSIPTSISITGPCPTGMTAQGTGCVWPTGATTPCYSITGQ